MLSNQGLPLADDPLCRHRQRQPLACERVHHRQNVQLSRIR